jgi:hypothetical protein
VAALTAIQAEWSSRETAYLVRIDNLKDPDASVFLIKGVTVQDDGDADVLTGAQHLDWFFVSPLDNVTDQNKGEVVN